MRRARFHAPLRQNIRLSVLNLILKVNMPKMSDLIKKHKELWVDQRYLILPQSVHPPIAGYGELIKNLDMKKSVFWPRMYCEEPGSQLTVNVGQHTLFSQKMAMAHYDPRAWSAIDVSEWMGKTLEITAEITEDEEATFNSIHLASDLGEQFLKLYHEKDRPQFHFSYRHGFLGDPTAMVYYPPRQEWHMFTIHNPFRGLEICWGHAVSKDLLHWEEHAPIFHPPYKLFNGVGFTDARNILGLNRDGEQAVILLTPIMGREDGFISMTVSVDGGNTFSDMNDLRRELGREDLPENPIVPGWGDAPRIHWNPVAQKYFLTHCRWQGEPGKMFVQILQYTSANLVNWTRVDDFPLVIDDNFPGEGDPPDSIALPLDRHETDLVVVLVGGRNGYVLGRYGESGLENLRGEPLSSEDTIPTQHCGFPTIFSGAPGGRGIGMFNVGSDRISGIPNFEVDYKPNMSFPIELSVRSTPAGPRLFQNPIPEIAKLYGRSHTFDELRLGDETATINGPEGGLYRMQAVLEGRNAEAIDLVIMGYTITYDVKNGTIGGERDELWWPDRETSSQNGHHSISQKDDAIRIDMLIDRTSIELFPNEGERYIHYGKLKLYEHEGAHFTFAARGGEAVIRRLKVIEINSIW